MPLTTVHYVKKESPDHIIMSYIEKGHDVSQILAQLATEEGGNLSPGPESAADTDSVSEETMEVSISNARGSTSSVEALSGVYHRRHLGTSKKNQRPQPYPNLTARASLSGRSQIP